MKGRYRVRMPNVYDYHQYSGKVAKDRWHIFTHLCRLLYAQGLDYEVKITEEDVIITASGEAVRPIPKPIRWSNGELINLRIIKPGKTPLEECTAKKLAAIELAESPVSLTEWVTIDGRYQQVGRDAEDVLAEQEGYALDVEYWTEMERLALPVEVREILEKESKSCKTKVLA